MQPQRRQVHTDTLVRDSRACTDPHLAAAAAESTHATPPAIPAAAGGQVGLATILQHPPAYHSTGNPWCMSTRFMSRKWVCGKKWRWRWRWGTMMVTTHQTGIYTGGVVPRKHGDPASDIRRSIVTDFTTERTGGGWRVMHLHARPLQCVDKARAPRRLIDSQLASDRPRGRPNG